MIPTETPVLSVSHLETAEVSFEPVGVTDEVGVVVDEVEHMGQRMDNQAAGAFEIAEHTAALGSEIDLPAVLYLPRDESIDPQIAVDACVDGAQLQKQVAQALGIWSFGTAAAPGETLALNVNQAALQDDGRPLGVQVTQQLGIPVGGNAGGGQSTTRQLCTERRHVPRSLVDTVDAGEDTVGVCVHHDGDRNAAATKIRTVDQQVPMPRQIAHRERFLIQPVVNDAPQCPRAVAALLPQLPHVVSFAHPSLKPDPLTVAATGKRAPDKRPMTTPTPPTLFASAGETRTHHIVCATMRTVLFDPLLKLLRKNLYNVMSNTRIQPLKQHFLAIMPMLRSEATKHLLFEPLLNQSLEWHSVA